MERVEKMERKIAEVLESLPLKKVSVKVENYYPSIMWDSTYRRYWRWNRNKTEGESEILSYPDVREFLSLLTEIFIREYSPLLIDVLKDKEKSLSELFSRLESITKKKRHRAGVEILFEGETFELELKTFADRKKFSIKMGTKKVEIKVDWWEGGAYEYEVKIFIPKNRKLEEEEVKEIEKILPYCDEVKDGCTELGTIIEKETFYSVFLPVIEKLFAENIGKQQTTPVIEKIFIEKQWAKTSSFKAGIQPNTSKRR